ARRRRPRAVERRRPGRRPRGDDHPLRVLARGPAAAADRLDLRPALGPGPGGVRGLRPARVLPGHRRRHHLRPLERHARGAPGPVRLPAGERQPGRHGARRAARRGRPRADDARTGGPGARGAPLGHGGARRPGARRGAARRRPHLGDPLLRTARCGLGGLRPGAAAAVRALRPGGELPLPPGRRSGLRPTPPVTSPATAPDTLDPAPSRRITRAHRGRSMTQGYGPEHGQQGQWGQGGQAPQAPQWGQASPAAPSQPQWGQASPAAPYATGPGSSPAAPAAPARRVRGLSLCAIAVLAVRVLYLLSNIIVSAFIVGVVQSAVSGDDAMASAGIGVLLLLLGLVVVDIVSVALLVLAIVVVVKSSGRTRTGAIVVGAAVLASFLVYLATRFLFFM